MKRLLLNPLFVFVAVLFLSLVVGISRAPAQGYSCGEIRQLVQRYGVATVIRVAKLRGYSDAQIRLARHTCRV